MRITRVPPSRRVWIFDLDNTLHDARPEIFPEMHRQINAYVQRRFGVDEAGANQIRSGFWQQYGTTLKGLMRHHGEDPHKYLRETHQFPELSSMVVRENALRHALARLEGRKLVFSNAPRQYVEGVLDALGYGRFFDAVYTIESTRFQPKPAFQGFRMVLRAHNLSPGRCAMVDDMLENLRTAKRMGMSTVWVGRERARRVPYVDLRVASVSELPRLAFRYLD
jgi:putative hydrolase of the HAD superfamily